LFSVAVRSERKKRAKKEENRVAGNKIYEEIVRIK